MGRVWVWSTEQLDNDDDDDDAAAVAAEDDDDGESQLAAHTALHVLTILRVHESLKSPWCGKKAMHAWDPSAVWNQRRVHVRLVSPDALTNSKKDMPKNVPIHDKHAMLNSLQVWCMSGCSCHCCSLKPSKLTWISHKEIIIKRLKCKYIFVKNVLKTNKCELWKPSPTQSNMNIVIISIVQFWMAKKSKETPSPFFLIFLHTRYSGTYYAFFQIINVITFLTKEIITRFCSSLSGNYASTYNMEHGLNKVKVK